MPSNTSFSNIAANQQSGRVNFTGAGGLANGASTFFSLEEALTVAQLVVAPPTPGGTTPEPMTLALVPIGLLGLAQSRRNRKT